ncbi:hypothetical protein DFH09DRAFT_1370381 [Mycena vulgaris]|nr:hypothetical protein DFH09DRAFT_1370381 [Mycena vulgaris]
MDDDNPPFHLPWPHSEFLALSERSLFHAHLHTLDLQQVVITAGELLESLSALPALEELLISDQPDDFGGASAEILITDDLLAALTRTPHSPPLVSRLHYLSCESSLQFDDSVYLNFLVSRLSTVRPFECELFWLAGHNRPLDPTV